MKEVQKLRIIHNCIDGIITQNEAGIMLDVSDRQIRNIIKKVKIYGEEGIKHKGIGIKSVNAIDNVTKNKIVELKLTKYKDTNFAHFRDLLEEYENMNFSYTTIYNLLRSNGIISKKQMKRRKKHRIRAKRKKVGELLQMDASKHDWFNNGSYCHLHGAVDDASGIVTGAIFDKEETTNAYFEITKQTIINYGIPIAFYVDGRGTFFPNNHDKLTDEEILQGKLVKKTQYTEAISRLGINLIHAHSAQAKGCIERLWSTFQDRLIVELKLNNISNIEQANKFLIKNFLPRYNKKFSKIIEGSSFVKIKDDINLDLILAKRESRKISSGCSFSYNGNKYFVVDTKLNLVNVQPYDIIEIIETTRGLQYVSYDNIYYNMIKSEDYYRIDKQRITRDILTNYLGCNYQIVSKNIKDLPLI